MYVASVQSEAVQEPVEVGPGAEEASVPRELHADDLDVSVSQLFVVIDAVVHQMKETPQGKKLPAEWFAQLVQMLKRRYQDSEIGMYARSHVTELSELIGHLCGEAASEFSSEPGADC